MASTTQPSVTSTAPNKLATASTTRARFSSTPSPRSTTASPSPSSRSAPDGSVDTERIELSPRRDVRVIEGELDELLKGPTDGAPSDDYLLLRLTDRKAILDAIGKLRQVYPNVLHLERPGLQSGQSAELKGGDHLKRSEVDLYKDFYQEVTGNELIDGGEELFNEVVAALLQAKGEGGA